MPWPACSRLSNLSRPVSHGDLSTKNVLWSLQRGPEVFVIDCDNCERFGPDVPPTPFGVGAGP